jgi:RNA polymerase sigma-70 factor (ECF subfamily)
MALLMAATEAQASHDERTHVRLWDAHSPAIYRYCFRSTADAALADDLTSIVFLEAWRRRGDVTLPPEAELPWLYGVATNVLRNQRRSQRRHRAALARLPRPLDEPDFADSLGDRLDDERRMRSILGQVGNLSGLEREVLAMCVWEGLAPRAAALALGIPEATVRTRLHRAREHLRTLSEGGADFVKAPKTKLDATQGDLS